MLAGRLTAPGRRSGRASSQYPSLQTVLHLTGNTA